ncbi:c-type cytochrome [Rhodoblastus sp.]|jgi:cytochrome c553|uniref:c-type cytochrome n=1 Tax=Rhodoblastus sp. TaxID=1962975 RepID=UPI002628B234|nr:c-type cytochrome [Rhodoblastus sp.]
MASWKRQTLLALSLAGIFAGLSATARAEDAPGGKQLFMSRTCVACHGRDGSKAILMYPNLAAQNEAYLYEQMKDIASGKRVSGPDARGYPRTQAMKDVMGVVSDDELKTIAAWLAALPSPPVKPGDAAKATEGEAIYAKSGCVGCHGAKGIKPTAGYPVIGGQKKEYLALQIKEIRDGVRNNGRSKLMTAMVKRVSDADVDALSEYLSQVDRSAAK